MYLNQSIVLQMLHPATFSLISCLVTNRSSCLCRHCNGHWSDTATWNHSLHL